MLLQKNIEIEKLFIREFLGHTGLCFMEGKWVNECQQILSEIRSSKKDKGQDRLDMVRTIRFTNLC